MIRIEELLSIEERAYLYGSLTGNLDMIEGNPKELARKGYEMRNSRKPLSRKVRNKIKSTLDIHTIEGKEQYERRNKKRLAHETMLAKKNEERRKNK